VLRLCVPAAQVDPAPALLVTCDVNEPARLGPLAGRLATAGTTIMLDHHVTNPGFGDLRMGDVPDPAPGPGEVVVDVACVQPSVTECMLIAGEPVAQHGHLAAALAHGPVRFGGHEFCGVVAAADLVEVRRLSASTLDAVVLLLLAGVLLGYAVELLRVQEVGRTVPIVAMRGAAPSVLGAMNLRGRIVPVFDLGLWLGTERVTPDERARIVVVERDNELIGALVSAVDDVVTLGPDRIEPPLMASPSRAIVGVARVVAKPTVLLDANALFG